MKIAVATDDFKSVTGHVGRCNGFLIYNVEKEQIIDTQCLENNFTNHTQSNQNKGAHSHSSLIEGLNDCTHLICKMAGPRLKDDFERRGKSVVFTNERSAFEAVLKFLNGNLEINEKGICNEH